MSEFLLQNLNFILPFFLLILGYSAGSIAEKRHYRSIERREQKFLALPAVTLKDVQDNEKTSGQLVIGNAVISIDYFKRALAILRNIFGGRVASYESLVDRARREAILRMKEEAAKAGAHIIVNMRIETSAIGQSANRKKQIGSVEAIAYGTALIKQA